MKYDITLLLPALIPSWNFFDVIVPSPRIQFSLLNKENKVVKDWSEFRPRPTHVSVWKMLGRMFWNPDWNESLYLMSCAERLIDYPTQHSEDEIFRRIKADVVENKENNFPVDIAKVKFRLVFIRREGKQLKEEVRFESQVRSIINEYVDDD